MDDFCFAITCFNRERLYYNTLASLHRMLPTANILIYDDGSETIDHNITREYFPAAQIFRAEVPSGRADIAIFRSMKLFLETTTFRFVILTDSDLIFDKSLPRVCNDLMLETDGFCSIFNTPNHAGVTVDKVWCVKQSVGSAGCIFRRDLLETIVNEVPLSHTYDWDWCRYLQVKQLRILCTNRSYVQHLGFFYGQNSSPTSGDFGEMFLDYEDLNKSIILCGFVDALRAIALR